MPSGVRPCALRPAPVHACGARRLGAPGIGACAGPGGRRGPLLRTEEALPLPRTEGSGLAARDARDRVGTEADGCRAAAAGPRRGASAGTEARDVVVRGDLVHVDPERRDRGGRGRRGRRRRLAFAVVLVVAVLQVALRLFPGAPGARDDRRRSDEDHALGRELRRRAAEARIGEARRGGEDRRYPGRAKERHEHGSWLQCQCRGEPVENRASPSA